MDNKAKKPKKKKDPKAPKAAMTGYLLYLNDARARVQQANPGILQKDIMTKVAEEWKTLTDADKQVCWRWVVFSGAGLARFAACFPP